MFDFVSKLTPGKAFDKGLIGNTVDRFFMSSVKDTIMKAFVQGRLGPADEGVLEQWVY